MKKKTKSKIVEYVTMSAHEIGKSIYILVPSKQRKILKLKEDMIIKVKLEV